MEIHNEETNPVLQPIQCNICQKSFVYNKLLEKHILKKHMNDKDICCTQCFKSKQLVKSFSTKALLNKHIKVVHGPPRFKCQVCFKTFQVSSNLAMHMRAHFRIRKDKCSICLKAFASNKALQKHLFYVHKERSENKVYFKCDICSKEFLDRYELEKHVISQHVVDKAFECPVCSKTFIDQHTLDMHMKRHDNQLKYVCDVCSKGFKCRLSLVRHLRVNHKKLFYCSRKCHRSFTNRKDFDEHISDSKQELKCYICQEIINSECNLKIHLDSHVKEIKPEKIKIKIENNTKSKNIGELFKEDLTKEFSLDKFQCQLCSKTFDREAYFTAHRNQMHPNAEWRCNFEHCIKSFRSYNKLQQHKITHTETKQFACNICQKSFHLPNQLRYHEKIHLENRKFKCEMCPKSFFASSRLRIHVAHNHGGLKPFKCPALNCGTSWAGKNYLKKHLVSHQTKKSFQCEMCTTFKTFKSLKTLKIHQKSIHSALMETTTRKSLKNLKTKTRKHSDAIVFICSSNNCSFETVSETEVALHYSLQHHLPKVQIFWNSSSSFPSCELLVSGKCKNSQGSSRMIEKRYKCKICSKLFKSLVSFSEHQLSHYIRLQFQCSDCSESFKYKKTLKRHIYTFHTEAEKRPKALDPVQQKLKDIGDELQQIEKIVINYTNSHKTDLYHIVIETYNKLSVRLDKTIDIKSDISKYRQDREALHARLRYVDVLLSTKIHKENSACPDCRAANK